MTKFADSIRIPADANLPQLASEIGDLLTELGFKLTHTDATRIFARKRSATGTTDYTLAIRLEPGWVRMHAGASPRVLFLVLLPITGCGMACAITCGVFCALSCTCGVAGIFMGQALVGINAYTNHVFKLIAEVIREKGRPRGLCGRCGTPFPTQARFCRHCGTQLAP